jgi:hypothetical protein
MDYLLRLEEGEFLIEPMQQIDPQDFIKSDLTKHPIPCERKCCSKKMKIKLRYESK